MSDKHSENKKSQHRTGIIGGILVLTSFASFGTQSGLISQLGRSLDGYLVPAAQAKVVESERVAIADAQLVKELGADTLVINGNAAFVVNGAGEKKVAPNGYYKLSNGLIITVKDGAIAEQATVKPSTDKMIAWKDCLVRGNDGSSPWMQCSRATEETQLEAANVDSQVEKFRVSVRETLNRIIES